MLWRSIIILVVHITAIFLVWAGYSWLEQGQGLNPLIAFPAAVIIYTWSWLWIVWEARYCEQKIENYLEWLEEQEENLKIMAKMPDDYEHSVVKGGLIEIIKQKHHWNIDHSIDVKNDGISWDIRD